MQTATVTVYNGMREYRITGKIVRSGEKFVTVEDERGCRWSASRDRAIVNGPRSTAQNFLW